MRLEDKIHELPTTARDITGLFFGEVIGSGMSRTVYQHLQDPSLVLKVELSGTRFQNVLEWEIWNTVKDTKMAKWFAPCIDISANGIVLIQKKVAPIPEDQYPKKLPSIFGDTKYQNFGKIGKQFVCFDYGTSHINAINSILIKNKTKVAKWWKE